MAIPALEVVALLSALALPTQVVPYLVTATLATHTASADGNTLTKSTNGALTLDGETPEVGETFAYVPSAGSAESGFYRVVAIGSGGAPWSITRVDGWLAGRVVETVAVRCTVLSGTVAGRSYLLFGATPGAVITLGTTSLTVFVDAPGAVTATYLDTTGTPGSATANTGSGRSSCAIGQSVCTITNSQVVAASVVLITLEDRDATAIAPVCTPGAGSFAVTFAANATAATRFRWALVRPVTPIS